MQGEVKSGPYDIFIYMEYVFISLSYDQLQAEGWYEAQEFD